MQRSAEVKLQSECVVKVDNAIEDEMSKWLVMMIDAQSRRNLHLVDYQRPSGCRCPLCNRQQSPGATIAALPDRVSFPRNVA